MIHLGIGLGVQYGSAAGALSQPNPIAVARINAIYAAGGSCPVGQATAISLLSDFINAEQSAGRWANHRRIYIPGWGNAAANAIDIVTGASGTFSVSGVTHGAGFVQGNGTTGFFNAGSPLSDGCLADSSSIWQMSLTDDADGVNATCGYRGTGAQRFSCGQLASSGLGRRPIGNLPGGAEVLVNATSQSLTGFQMASTISRNDLRLFRRSSAGFVTVGTSTTTSTENLLSINAFFMAWNNNGTAQNFSSAQKCAYGYGRGLTASEATGYSLNLRTLWQGLFQLSLP